MQAHEYANIYRMLPDNELAKLADDIKTKGQLLPITLYEGRILDGRNRYRACEMAGVTPITTEYTGDDPLGLISSLNDHRRHDSENERAMVGARMANLRKGGAGGATISDSSMETSQPAVSIERAAELSGSSPANIKRAKAIVKEGIPELQDMAESGEVSIRAASEVAKLPEDEQRKAVQGGASGVKQAAKRAQENLEKAQPQPQKPIGPISPRSIKIRECNGMAIFASAEMVMNRLNDNDEEFEQSLNAMIAYCENRKHTRK